MNAVFLCSNPNESVKEYIFLFFFFLFLVDPMFSPHSTSMTMMEEHIYRSVGLLEKRSLPGLFTK